MPSRVLYRLDHLSRFGKVLEDLFEHSINFDFFV